MPLPNYMIPTWRLGKLRDATLTVDRPTCLHPKEAAAIFRMYFATAHREVCAAIILDSQRRVTSVAHIKEGRIDEIDVTAREVFETVLAERGAHSFILGHNHTGGSVKPSMRDTDFMREIHALGRRLDCELKDFLIMGDDSAYWSARNEGYEI